MRMAVGVSLRVARHQVIDRCRAEGRLQPRPSASEAPTHEPFDARQPWGHVFSRPGGVADRLLDTVADPDRRAASHSIIRPPANIAQPPSPAYSPPSEQTPADFAAHAKPALSPHAPGTRTATMSSCSYLIAVRRTRGPLCQQSMAALPPPAEPALCH